MQTSLIKNFIEIEQTLFESQTDAGLFAVHRTALFGNLLTVNGEVLLSENDSFFYYEMMTHPALFSHPKPQHVAIEGNNLGILQEVLKHAAVLQVSCVEEEPILSEVISHYFSGYKINDDRITTHAKTSQWLLENKFDVVIAGETKTPTLDHYQRYYHALQADGILVTPLSFSLLQASTLKDIYQLLNQAGFIDWQILHFPQPSYLFGWRAILMATKHPFFKRLREKDVYNRAFSTRYYNFDVHKAATVLPEFLRDALVGNTL